MPLWPGRELERQTAGRLASAGIVPVLNILDPHTQSEFDIYGYIPYADHVERLLVQCSTSYPSHTRLMALRGFAETFGADHSLFVTTCHLQKPQINLAAEAGVSLVSTNHPGHHSATICGRTVDLSQPLDPPATATLRSLRCLSYLERLALDAQRFHPMAEVVVDTLNEIRAVQLHPSSFERAELLYGAHNEYPDLSQLCAVEEGLEQTPLRALKQAFAYNGGSYTQTALAVQTMNRVLTLMTVCECACDVAGGEEVPASLMQGRIGPLIQWLANEQSRQHLALFAFMLHHGWGGFWPDQHRQSVHEGLANALDIVPETVERLLGFVDHLYADAGMGSPWKPVQYYDAHWTNLWLLPYFAKGIGVRRLMEHHTATDLDVGPWQAWAQASVNLEHQCESYEMNH